MSLSFENAVKITCHVKSVKLLYESVLLVVVVIDDANDSFNWSFSVDAFAPVLSVAIFRLARRDPMSLMRRSFFVADCSMNMWLMLRDRAILLFFCMDSIL